MTSLSLAAEGARMVLATVGAEFGAVDALASNFGFACRPSQLALEPEHHVVQHQRPGPHESRRAFGAGALTATMPPGAGL